MTQGTDSTTAQRKPKADRWRQIVQCATEVFFEKGYEAASLQDIADRVGILKGSIYYYIGSKEDLLGAVIEQVHVAGIANIDALAATEGNALERLRRVIIGHIVHVCATLVPTTVFLHELGALSEERREAILGGSHSYQQVFRELIIEGKREGTVREDIDAKLAALSLLGSLNWIYRWFRADGEFTPHEIGEQFADLHLRGLATAAALEALREEDFARISATASDPA